MSYMFAWVPYYISEPHIVYEAIIGLFCKKRPIIYMSSLLRQWASCTYTYATCPRHMSFIGLFCKKRPILWNRYTYETQNRHTRVLIWWHNSQYWYDGIGDPRRDMMTRRGSYDDIIMSSYQYCEFCHHISRDSCRANYVIISVRAIMWHNSHNMSFLSHQWASYTYIYQFGLQIDIHESRVLTSLKLQFFFAKEPYKRDNIHIHISRYILWGGYN